MSLPFWDAVGERRESGGTQRRPPSLWGGDWQLAPQRSQHAVQDHHSSQQHSDSGDASSGNHPALQRRHQVSFVRVSSWREGFRRALTVCFTVACDRPTGTPKASLCRTSTLISSTTRASIALFCSTPPPRPTWMTSLWWQTSQITLVKKYMCKTGSQLALKVWGWSHILPVFRGQFFSCWIPVKWTFRD